MGDIICDNKNYNSSDGDYVDSIINSNKDNSNKDNSNDEVVLRGRVILPRGRSPY